MTQDLLSTSPPLHLQTNLEVQVLCGNWNKTEPKSLDATVIITETTGKKQWLRLGQSSAKPSNSNTSHFPKLILEPFSIRRPQDALPPVQLCSSRSPWIWFRALWRWKLGQLCHLRSIARCKVCLDNRAWQALPAAPGNWTEKLQWHGCEGNQPCDTQTNHLETKALALQRPEP